MEIDLGDVVARFDIRVKRFHYGVRFHVGAPVKMTEAERLALPKTGPTTSAQNRKAAVLMDWLDDQKALLEVDWTDDVGNPTSAPAEFTASFASDNPAVIVVTDNGDGTAEMAATGQLGTANVHLEASTGGNTVSGDLALNVVASLATRVNIKVGTPEHV